MLNEEQRKLIMFIIDQYCLYKEYVASLIGIYKNNRGVLGGGVLKSQITWFYLCISVMVSSLHNQFFPTDLKFKKFPLRNLEKIEPYP